MKNMTPFLTYFIAILLSTTLAYASGDKSLESDTMLSDIEKEVNLPKEELDTLKPSLDEKSNDFKQSLHDAIDKGFLEFDELLKKFTATSKDIQTKTNELLTSEEAKKLHDYLNKVDKAAIKQAKDSLVAELSALLKLTEEQANKIEPALSKSFSDLSSLLGDFMKSGSDNIDQFRSQFDQITKELKERLQEHLDKEQMETLEKHNQKLKEEIQQAVFSV